jgi:hypothetical protein
MGYYGSHMDTDTRRAGLVAYPGGMSRTFRNALLNVARTATDAEQNEFLDWVGGLIRAEGSPSRGSAAALVLWDEYRALRGRLGADGAPVKHRREP